MAKGDKKWVATSIPDVGLVLGVTGRTVSEYLARGCPGKPGNYPLPEIIAWCKETVWKSRTAATDPMLAGDDSPALERYREARASQEEIKLDQLRRDSLPLEEIRVIHDELADIYRRAGEQLQREFGLRVLEVIEQCLKDATSRMEQRWGSDRVGPTVSEV